MCDCRYERIKNEKYAYELISKYLPNRSFRFTTKNNYCMIKRETIYSVDYKGFILTREK